MSPTLHLLPVPLAELQYDAVCTPRVREALQLISLVIAENPRTARRVLPGLGYTKPLQELEVLPYDEHSKTRDIAELLAQLKKHEHSALLSEAGAPCIADPGSRIVRGCHQHGIRVIPHAGASAIVLALMASGLNGQHFTFHGYLPIPTEERVKALREIEQRSKQEQSSQIFIETPYRTAKLFSALCENLQRSTEICVAQNLTALDQEQIHTMSVAEWKSRLQEIQDVPTVFIVQSAH